jgi:hypothetical protein
MVLDRIDFLACADVLQKLFRSPQLLLKASLLPFYTVPSLLILVQSSMF